MANSAQTAESTPVGPKKGRHIYLLKKVRNFSVLHEGNCKTAFFAYWGPFDRQRRAWPDRADSPRFHMHTGEIANFSKFGFSPGWVRCRWSPQARWAPPEHPSDTSHAISASCCRVPFRPVSQELFKIIRHCLYVRPQIKVFARHCSLGAGYQSR